MPWDAARRLLHRHALVRARSGQASAPTSRLQNGDSASLLSHYRRWIALRDRLPALCRGGLKLLSSPLSSSPLLLFERIDGGRRLLVVHNFGGAAASAAVGPVAAAVYLEGEGRARRSERGLEIELPPYGSAVFALD